MLSSREISLPDDVREKLIERSNFSDSYGRYTRSGLMAFEQPVAAVAGLTAPVLISLVYVLGGPWETLQSALLFGFATFLILTATWILKRTLFHEGYERAKKARARAKADLKHDTVFENQIQLKQPAMFCENKDGVAVFAAASLDKTIFFNIRADRDDPRWYLYLNGDLYRECWSWIQLPATGDIMNYKSAGLMKKELFRPAFIETDEIWDAIAMALGDPVDGDIIDLPLSEVQSTVGRLLGTEPQQEFALAS